jgi:peptidoglycan/LPS O-acetylase OafA/YrhL
VASHGFASVNKQTSIKLDLVRWLAAFMVAASHFTYVGTSLVSMHAVEPIGHLGVLIFFVMSGWVIRFVADGRHADARDYLEARWARINSVFLPALALTIACDLLGRQLDPALYARYPVPDLLHIVAYTPFFVTFLSENSVHSLRWFSNGPLWSVAYEVWYYAIFCTFFYFKGRTRWLLTGLAVLLAGYKIVLLMPLWLAGCVVYKLRDTTEQIPLMLRRVACTLSLAGIVYICTPDGNALLEPLRELGRAATGQGFHQAFLSDYLACILIVVFLATFCSQGVIAVPQALFPIVKWGAAFSFSLYAFHLPIISLLRASGLYDVSVVWQAFAAYAAVVAICWAISLATEQRKAVWRALARQLGDVIVRLAGVVGIGLPSGRRA